MRGSQKKETANEGGVFFPIDEKVPLPELFANFLKFLMVKDRKRYLEFATQLYPDEKANGFYKRNLNSGYGPVEVDVPRTRSSEFRPYILPEHWKRLHPELESLLKSAHLCSEVRREPQGNPGDVPQRRNCFVRRNRREVRRRFGGILRVD